MTQIDPKDVEFGEYTEYCMGAFSVIRVIATVRYTRGVIVDREAIEYFGKDVLDHARAQALASLVAAQLAAPKAGETISERLKLPPVKTGEEKP